MADRAREDPHERRPARHRVMATTTPFQRFVDGLTHLLDETAGDETAILDRGRPLLAALLATGDWLPPEASRADAARYQQYLLYLDPAGRCSVASFVWAPGQSTPIHDHTVWGLIGVLCGGERSERFEVPMDRSNAASGPLRSLGLQTLHPGDIDAVSPRIGDIHRVANAYDDRVSISIHVYGGDIGRIRRHIYDPATGARAQFVSSYSNGKLGGPPAQESQ